MDYSNEPKYVELNTRLIDKGQFIDVVNDEYDDLINLSSHSIIDYFRTLLKKCTNTDLAISQYFRGDIDEFEIGSSLKDDYRWDINVSLKKNDVGFRRVYLRIPSIRQFSLEDDKYNQKLMFTIVSFIIKNMTEIEENINNLVNFSKIDEMADKLSNLRFDYDTIETELNEYINKRDFEEYDKLIVVGAKIDINPKCVNPHRVAIIDKVMRKTFTFSHEWSTRHYKEELINKVKRGQWAIVTE